MKKLALAWAMSVVFIRLGLVVNAFMRPGWLPIVFGASEFLALCTTIYAIGFGRVDFSVAGMLIPFLYAAPLLFDLSNPSGPGWAAGFYLLLAPIQWAVRLRLGLRCTVAAPVLISVVDGFPYCFIRHPLGALEMLMCTFIAAWVWSPYNAAVWIVVMVSSIVCMLIEEQFLSSESSYLQYTARVRWRCIPGVW
jgi:protein-S-isoprenylcysteine O-methyltransferase Ste14